MDENLQTNILGLWHCTGGHPRYCSGFHRAVNQEFIGKAEIETVKMYRPEVLLRGGIFYGFSFWLTIAICASVGSQSKRIEMIRFS